MVNVYSQSTEALDNYHNWVEVNLASVHPYQEGYVSAGGR